MSVSQTRRMTTTKYDAAHYAVQLVRPTAYRPEGDTTYDYTLDPLPHFLQVLAISVCGNGAHILLGRHHVPTPRAYRPTRLWAVFAQWPRIANRPWLAESVTEFWGKRWHQFFRQFFVVYGSRPGKKVVRCYGSIMGAYLVSAHLGSRTRAGAST